MCVVLGFDGEAKGRVSLRDADSLFVSGLHSSVCVPTFVATNAYGALGVHGLLAEA